MESLLCKHSPNLEYFGFNADLSSLWQVVGNSFDTICSHCLRHTSIRLCQSPSFVRTTLFLWFHTRSGGLYVASHSARYTFLIWLDHYTLAGKSWLFWSQVFVACSNLPLVVQPLILLTFVLFVFRPFLVCWLHICIADVFFWFLVCFFLFRWHFTTSPGRADLETLIGVIFQVATTTAPWPLATAPDVTASTLSVQTLPSLNQTF